MKTKKINDMSQKKGRFLIGLIVGVVLMLVIGKWQRLINREVVEPKEWVDYVNPYMGNISHLLVPTYPTVHLPNSMLRVYPERTDYTSDQLAQDKHVTYY